MAHSPRRVYWYFSLHWSFPDQFLLRKFLLSVAACYLVLLALFLVRLTDRPSLATLVALHAKLLIAVVAVEVLLHAAMWLLGVEQKVLDARVSLSS